jgi:glycine dehydrogenase subunit 1
MRYLPKSPADREAMLKAIGLRSVDDLFAPIPAEYRLTRDLNIPRQMAESEIVDFFRPRSRENGDGYTSFLGAGAYFHYRPVIIDSLISRGEFLTAYTPYQAEISQGTLQSIFEFQTMICELTGMEVANASMYDGSTAAAEGVMRPSAETAVASANTSPTPPAARDPRLTRCQSFGTPSTAEYWHIGDRTMRFLSVRLLRW